MAATLVPLRFVPARSLTSCDEFPVTLRLTHTFRRPEATMEDVAAPSSGAPQQPLSPQAGLPPEDELDDDDEELDETLAERLWGLTEMFPDSLRTVAGVACDFSVTAAKKMYSFSRSALWVGTTSFMILVLPVVFETEKLQMEQHQQLQQRQILLGPTAGMSGALPGPLPPMSGKL